jgi:hypothetical protein
MKRWLEAVILADAGASTTMDRVLEPVSRERESNDDADLDVRNPEAARWAAGLSHFLGPEFLSRTGARLGDGALPRVRGACLVSRPAPSNRLRSAQPIAPFTCYARKTHQPSARALSDEQLFLHSTFQTFLRNLRLFRYSRRRT